MARSPASAVVRPTFKRIRSGLTDVQLTVSVKPTAESKRTSLLLAVLKSH